MIGKSLSIAAWLVAALGLSGAGFSAVADSSPTPPQTDSWVVFTKDTQIQYLWVVRRPGCGDIFGDKLIKVPRDASVSDPVAIASGKEANILAIARYSSFMCPNIGSFTPEAGHTYDIKQRILDMGCRLEVVDRATGLRPPSWVARSPSDVCPLRWPKFMQVRPRR